MSRFFIGWHSSRPFKPQIKIFLGVVSCFAILENYINVSMCIFIGECSTKDKISTKYVNNMATYLGLD
jgi:hypothetical protein